MVGIPVAEVVVVQVLVDIRRNKPGGRLCLSRWNQIRRYSIND